MRENYTQYENHLLPFTYVGTNFVYLYVSVNYLVIFCTEIDYLDTCLKAFGNTQTQFGIGCGQY